MAKGNPKGNPQFLTPQGRHKLTSEDSAKGGRVTGKRKKVKALIDEILSNEDMIEILQNLKDRSRDSSKDLELLLAIIGEKPKEQIEVSQDAPFEVSIQVIE
jgi:hypothetical protein